MDPPIGLALWADLDVERRDGSKERLDRSRVGAELIGVVKPALVCKVLAIECVRKYKIVSTN